MWSFTWHWRIHITITGPEAFRSLQCLSVIILFMPECACEKWMNVKRKVWKANSEHVPPTNYYQRQPTVNVNLKAHRQGKNNISAEPTSKYVIFTFPFRGQRSYQKTCSFIKVRVQVNTIKALTSQFYYKIYHQSFSLLGVVYYIIV